MARLLDQYGNPIDLTRLRQEEAGPTVTGIRQVISGHPAQGLNPVRLARLLRDAEEGDPTAYFELAEEMEEKDLHYRSVLATRKNQVAGLDITVEAASDKAEDVADAESDPRLAAAGRVAGRAVRHPGCRRQGHVHHRDHLGHF